MSLAMAIRRAFATCAQLADRTAAAMLAGELAAAKARGDGDRCLEVIAKIRAEHDRDGHEDRVFARGVIARYALSKGRAFVVGGAP